MVSGELTDYRGGGVGRGVGVGPGGGRRPGGSVRGGLTWRRAENVGSAHSAPLSVCRFSRSGKLIATGARDGGVVCVPLLGVYG